MNKYTKVTWGNCYFATLYLIIRGKAKKVIGVTSHSPIAPHHYVVYTKSGHILSFNHVKPHAENKLAPFWFEGRYECIKSNKVKHVLKEQNRKVGFIISPARFFIYASIVFALLIIPWCIGFFIYSPIWCIHGLINGLKKRWKF